MKNLNKILFSLILTFSIASNQGMTVETNVLLGDDDFSSSRCLKASAGIAFAGMVLYSVYYDGSAAINAMSNFLQLPYQKMAEQQICCMAAGEWQDGSWNLNLPTLFDNLPEPFKSNCYYIMSRSCQLGVGNIQPYLSSWDATWNRLPFCCQKAVYFLNYTQGY